MNHSVSGWVKQPCHETSARPDRGFFGELSTSLRELAGPLYSCNRLSFSPLFRNTGSEHEQPRYLPCKQRRPPSVDANKNRKATLWCNPHIGEVYRFRFAVIQDNPTTSIAFHHNPTQYIMSSERRSVQHLVHGCLQNRRFSSYTSKMVCNKLGPILNGTVDAPCRSPHRRIIH